MLPRFPGVPSETARGRRWRSGNIDNDPQLEIVFGSRGQRFFAFNYDGTEVLDGDANAGTIGVFK
jgi:hypothetical protein